MPHLHHLPVALDNIIEDAISKVFQSGVDSMGVPADETRAGSLIALVKSIHNSVHGAVARQLRQKNTHESLQARLPDALWCSVWTHLPFSALLDVGHTCSRWRTVSLGCPELWSHITFFIDEHALDCECLDCYAGSDGEGNHSQPSGWAQNPYRRSALSNVGAAHGLFARSGTTQLHLAIDIVPYRPARGRLAELVVALRNHKERIVGLHIRCAAAISAYDLLHIGGANAWPSLLDLTVEEMSNESGLLTESQIVLPTTTILSTLQFVRLVGSCSWPVDEWPYRNVRTLVMRPHEFSTKELRFLLISCGENLSELHIDLSALAYAPDLCDFVCWQVDALPLLAENVGSICISLPTKSPVFPQFEDLILLAFELPHRPELMLEYKRRDDVHEGPRIFQDLGAGIYLRVHCDPVGNIRMLSVQGTDVAGCTRRVALRVNDLPSHSDMNTILSPVFSSCWKCVVNLSIDSSLWRHIHKLAPALPSLTHLEIVVVNAEARKLKRPWLQLPALQTITLISHAGIISLCAACICRFLKWNLGIKARRRVPGLIALPLLQIDHRLLQEDSAPLLGIAKVVVVGVFHV